MYLSSSRTCKNVLWLVSQFRWKHSYNFKMNLSMFGDFNVHLDNSLKHSANCSKKHAPTETKMAPIRPPSQRTPLEIVLANVVANSWEEFGVEPAPLLNDIATLPFWLNIMSTLWPQLSTVADDQPWPQLSSFSLSPFRRVAGDQPSLVHSTETLAQRLGFRDSFWGF